MFPLSLKAIPILQQLSAAQCSLQVSDSQDNVVFIINQPKRIGPLPRPWDAQLMKFIVALHLVWVHMFLDLSPRSFCYFKGGYWPILGRLWFMMSLLLINNSSSRVLETQLATSEQVSLIKLGDTVSNSDLSFNYSSIASYLSHKSSVSFIFLRPPLSPPFLVLFALAHAIRPSWELNAQWMWGRKGFVGLDLQFSKVMVKFHIFMLFIFTDCKGFK